jgi:hypothetical protein
VLFAVPIPGVKMLTDKGFAAAVRGPHIRIGNQSGAPLIDGTFAHRRITVAIGALGRGDTRRATDATLGRDAVHEVLTETMGSSPGWGCRPRPRAPLRASRGT